MAARDKSGMIYGSVCSGIEAASVAWHPLGWRAAFLSEIEKFPRAVLSHHYPDVPLHGDFTTIGANDYEPIDALVGGTPCQSFSIAGLRGGLGDDRGNLALEFLRLADRLRPRWLVWENVPGVLSSNGGRDFGAILGAMVELGYGFAYRVLDAQFFGVPQRRRRVFVVGYLGDWRPAAAVLFEREGMRGDSAPRREAGKRATIGALAGTSPGGGWRIGADEAAAGQLVAFGGNNTAGAIDVATAVNAHGGPYGRMDFESETFVTFDTTQITSALNRSSPKPGDPCHPLAAGAHPPAIAFNSREDPCSSERVFGALGSSSPQAQAVVFAIQAGALRTNPNSGPEGLGVQSDHSFTLEARAEVQAVASSAAVRRLTPRECERLQGFPDDYTLVPHRGKPAADGPRYKALGNSMAVPVMRWIGERIQAVEDILQIKDAA